MSTESKLQRLLRKRVTLRRKPSHEAHPDQEEHPRKRNDFGFSMIQLVVAMIITAVLAAIAGPALWDLVFGAREQALQTNVQSAAEVLQTTLTQEAEHRTTTGSAGAPSRDALTAFAANLGVTWSDTWAMDAADNADTIRVQFLSDGASDLAKGPISSTAVTPVAPIVDWLVGNGGAVRLQARNQDGAWACALIVLQPALSAADTPLSYAAELGTVVTGNTAIVGAVANVPVATLPTATPTWTQESWNKRVVANIRGVWYDSGEAADYGLHNCSPVVDETAGSGPFATVPQSATEWIVANGRVLERAF